MRATYATTPQTSSGSLKLAFGRTPQPYFRPVDAGTATYREVYWRVYVRYPADWQGGGGDKLSRATSFVSADSWAQAMIAHVWSGGSSATWDYLVLDPASGTDSAGAHPNHHLQRLPQPPLARRGPRARPRCSRRRRWAAGTASRRMRASTTPAPRTACSSLWVDGQLDARREGLNWVGSYAAYGINAVFIENYWNAGSPVVQARYLDNLVVSTRAHRLSRVSGRRITAPSSRATLLPRRQGEVSFKAL